MTPWNDPTLSSWSAQKPKNSMNPSWVDGDVDPTAWGHPPKQVIIFFYNKKLLQAMQAVIQFLLLCILVMSNVSI